MYLLDTNICIFLIKKKPATLLSKIEACRKEEIFISSVTVAELEYGVAKSKFFEKNHLALLNFMSNFNNIIDFTSEDAQAYGIIRAYLEKRGTPIGPYDTQLAAQSFTRNLTLVTNNTGEFCRLPMIKLEDWSK